MLSRVDVFLCRAVSKIAMFAIVANNELLGVVAEPRSDSAAPRLLQAWRLIH